MIIVKNLIKYYYKSPILNNISFKVNKGEIFGIIGKSGAGKSTLLRCINGLEKYENGSIRVLNKEIKTLNNNELNLFRRDIGMIFQNFNLMKRKTVYENIAFPLKIHKQNQNLIQRKVCKLLKLVKLEEKKNNFISSLSGGEKQRVGIARALSLNPKILLCDEATSALDPKSASSILSLLNKINKKFKITIIIVSHQMEVIKTICKKTLILDDKEVKAIGTTENIFFKKNNFLKNILTETENEILSKNGVNIKIFFNKKNSEKTIITSMARSLDINFSIIGGRLELFRSNILGSLIINIPAANFFLVERYLEEKNIYWKVLRKK